MKKFLSNLKTVFPINFAVFLCLAPIHSPYPSQLSSQSQSLASETITISETTLEIDQPPRFNFNSDLIIKAVNPGYIVGKQYNVGELIELQNLTDAPLSLAGYSLRYTNGRNKATTLIKFGEGSLMTGEYLLLRYDNAPESAKSDLTYSTGIALDTGPLELIFDEDVVDQVCWTGKAGCEVVFKSTSPTTLVRDLQFGTFSHESEYNDHYNALIPNLVLPEEPDGPDDPSASEDPDETEDSSDEPKLTPQCRGLEFSEIFTYYSSDAAEQFVEFYNPTNHSISLDGCILQYKKKNYELTGDIASEGYFAYYPDGAFALTKNPSSSNILTLYDVDGEVIEEFSYKNGQKKSMSLARFFDSSGQASWRQTYQPTPNQENVYQEFRTCPAGKVINPETGNCVNTTTTSGTTTAECPAGKYRNPLTGRCKNIETSSTSKECAEGYERNPSTNRCRKIVSKNEGEDYALVPNTHSSKSTFVAIGAVALLICVGIVYIVLQFRHEIARAARVARQRLHDILKDLFSGKISLHRHKKP